LTSHDGVQAVRRVRVVVIEESSSTINDRTFTVNDDALLCSISLSFSFSFSSRAYSGHSFPFSLNSLWIVVSACHCQQRQQPRPRRKRPPARCVSSSPWRLDRCFVLLLACLLSLSRGEVVHRTLALHFAPPSCSLTATSQSPPSHQRSYPATFRKNRSIDLTDDGRIRAVTRNDAAHWCGRSVEFRKGLYCSDVYETPVRREHVQPIDEAIVNKQFTKSHQPPPSSNIIMASRIAFENSNEIGVFAALTNAYCLTGTYRCRSSPSFLFVVDE
jgi:hypothetical protein